MAPNQKSPLMVDVLVHPFYDLLQNNSSSNTKVVFSRKELERFQFLLGLWGKRVKELKNRAFARLVIIQPFSDRIIKARIDLFARFLNEAGRKAEAGNFLRCLSSLNRFSKFAERELGSRLYVTRLNQINASDLDFLNASKRTRFFVYGEFLFKTVSNPNAPKGNPVNTRNQACVNETISILKKKGLDVSVLPHLSVEKDYSNPSSAYSLERLKRKQIARAQRKSKPRTSTLGRRKRF